MIVTFCGHGDETYSDEIRKKINDTIEELILQGADEFLLGGYGKFDQMAATAVKAQKKKYPHIKSVLVVPYINRSFDKELYDYSEYPPLENWCYVKITDTLNLCFLVKSAKCTNWSHLFHGLLDNEPLMA